MRGPVDQRGDGGEGEDSISGPAPLFEQEQPEGRGHHRGFWLALAVVVVALVWFASNAHTLVGDGEAIVVPPPNLPGVQQEGITVSVAACSATLTPPFTVFLLTSPAPDQPVSGMVPVMRSGPSARPLTSWEMA